MTYRPRTTYDLQNGKINRHSKEVIQRLFSSKGTVQTQKHKHTQPIDCCTRTTKAVGKENLYI